MFPVRELDHFPWPSEAMDALLHVQRERAQLLLGHHMLQGADLLLHLTNHQIVGRKVQNVPQRIPLDEVRVLLQELFVVDGLDWFQAALEWKGRGRMEWIIGLF